MSCLKFRPHLALAALIIAMGCVALISMPAPAQAAGSQTDPATRATVHETLAVGTEHTCVIDAGAVRCWGRNDSGQLGYGNTDNVGTYQTSVGLPVNLL